MREAAALALLSMLLLGAWRVPLARAADSSPSGQATVQVTFFFTPGCRMCKPVNQAVDRAEQAYGPRIRVERVDLSDPQDGAEAAQRLFGLLDRHGVQGTPSLAVFVGDRCLAGAEAILDGLDAAIQAELDRAPAPQRAAHVDRTDLLYVAGVALADGFNPCAFAAVILLVSLMTVAGRSRREVVAIGLAFTAGVYVTYVVIGLFLYSALQRVSALHVVGDLVYYLAFGLCVVFGALSLSDAWRVWRGTGPERMHLHLPDAWRERIRRRLRASVHASHLFAAALASGVAVSVLESACTGQVYFPFLAGLARGQGAYARAVLLLLWYNLLFVLPLIGVFCAALAGVTSERLARFGRSNLVPAKVALALVFLAMAWVLWPALVWPPGAR